MGATTQPVPIQRFEITPETLEFTTGADTRNIKIKHYLCLRHSLPKTRLSQAILYENVSYGRQLAMKMDSMKTDRIRNSNALDFNQRAFRQIQQKKQLKWKRDDEVLLSNMNLPTVSLNSEADRPKSCKIMYRMNEFHPDGKKAETHGHAPVLPKMQTSVRRELTEIITHRDKTYMTKFPEVVEVDPKLIDRHNSYCGKKMLEEGGAGKDKRFDTFINALHPAKVDNDEYHVENLSSMSRFHKYGVRDKKSSPQGSPLTSPRMGGGGSVSSREKKALRDDVAKRFLAITSRESSFVSDTTGDPLESLYRSRRSGRPVNSKQRFQKRGEVMFETYKSDDVIYLSKHRKAVQEQIPEAEEQPKEDGNE